MGPELAVGRTLLVEGTLFVEDTLFVEGTPLVEGELLVEGTLLVGGKFLAAGEVTEELTEEGGVARGHAEQVLDGVPVGLPSAPEDGVGTGEPETEVAVPEGLGAGGTAESVESGTGAEVGLPAGIDGEGETPPSEVAVGVGTGNELSVRVLV